MQMTPRTDWQVTMAALDAAVRAWERAKTKGYVWLDGDTLFAVEADVPAGSDNPDQLRLV